MNGRIILIKSLALGRGNVGQPWLTSRVCNHRHGCASIVTYAYIAAIITWLGRRAVRSGYPIMNWQPAGGETHAKGHIKVMGIYASNPTVLNSYLLRMTPPPQPVCSSHTSNSFVIPTKWKSCNSYTCICNA